MGHARGETSTSQRRGSKFRLQRHLQLHGREKRCVCVGGGVMGKVCKQREVSKADLSCVFSIGEHFLTCRQPSLPEQEGRYPWQLPSPLQKANFYSISRASPVSADSQNNQLKITLMPKRPILPPILRADLAQPQRWWARGVGGWAGRRLQALCPPWWPWWPWWPHHTCVGILRPNLNSGWWDLGKKNTHELQRLTSDSRLNKTEANALSKLGNER